MCNIHMSGISYKPYVARLHSYEHAHIIIQSNHMQLWYYYGEPQSDIVKGDPKSAYS